MKLSRLGKLKLRLRREQLNYQSYMHRERKKETHQKILLGGLVYKAGLDAIDKEILLGSLIYLHETLQKNDALSVKTIKEFKLLGKEEFNRAKRSN